MSRLLAFAFLLLLLPVAPASAASGITSPGAGEVVAAESVVPLRAVVDGPVTGPSELSLLAPDSTTAEVVAVSTTPGGGELSYDLDTACATAVCAGRRPAANGAWTVRLSGAAEDERTFVLRIPPAAPLGVEAVRSEGGVLVRWQRGAEPDLRAYRVEDAAGRVVRDRIGLDACDAERFCSAEVPEAAGAWAVRAFRATCPDCTDLLPSPASDVAQAEDVSPGVPPTAGAPTAAPSSRPAARGPSQGDAFRDAFGSNSGRTVRGQAAAPRRLVPPAAPPPAASAGSELGYGQRELMVAEPAAPLSRAQDAVTSALGNGDRARLLVLSVVLVGASLWLRRWAHRPGPEGS